MADALDSGSSEDFLHAGSSPVSRIRSLESICFQGFFVHRNIVPTSFPENREYARREEGLALNASVHKIFLRLIGEFLSHE